jgi:serine/threonine protein kinase/Tfp pilus assembly protein PilF
MSPERWKQIEGAFNAALELPPEERAVFLDRACGDDSELRLAIERLLNADEQAGDFIAVPPQVSSLTRPVEPTIIEESLEVSLADQMIGRQIGPWRVEREIGRGGMGAVYLATRADNEFQKRVAIKLVKRGMDTDFIVRRFRHERQILASFDHPNIARLLDGGTTDDGRPWFVMEYIEGQPITRWCDDRRLSLTDRLKLFLQVCAAVQYAHQRQVIHRDLKPGNILVTADGTPKLLDFGIAKILDPELLLDSAELTVNGLHPMTPEYASPEQAQGLPITPASDQYALGVLLYELLTGRRPYRLRQRLMHEIARIICEEIPERPSVAINRAEENRPGETPELIGARRGTTPEALRQALSSGPDRIVMQALSKQPQQRYGSVAELAADINRYLQGLPVEASSEQTRQADPYQTGLIVQTQTPNSIAILPLKPLHASGASASVTRDFLSVGLADALITRLSNIQNLTVRPTSSVIRYAREETDALRAGRELSVSHVLDGRFLQAGERIRVTVQLISVHTAAPQWAAQFDESGADLLALQDSLAEQLSQEITRNLSGTESLPRIARRGTNNPQAYEAYLRGRYHWHTYTEDGLARAITCFYEAIALDPNFAAAYTGVADYFNWMGVTSVLPPEECFLAAKEAATKAVELDDELAEAYVSLAIVAWAYEWNIPTGSRLIKRAIELNGNYAQAYEWLAQFRSLQGRHTEAINAMKRALELDPQSPALHCMMSFILHNARQPAEALRYSRRALEIEPDYPLALQSRAWLFPHAGTGDEAVAAARQAVARTGRAPLALWALAHALAVTGKRREARAVLNEMIELARKRYVPHYFFARIHTALGEYPQAFERLHLAFDNYESWAQEAPVDPALDPLRSDPRFARLIARIQPRYSSDHEAETVIDPEKSAGGDSGRLLFSSVGLRRNQKSRAPVFAFAIALICVIGWIAWLKLSPASVSSGADRKTAPAVRSIAVLPFRTDTRAEADQSLGVGLADALGRKLGQIRQLSVRPPSAMRQYLTSDITPQQIAADQKVDYLISGNLRRAGELLRLELQLFGAEESKTLMNVEMYGAEDKLVSFQNALAERLLREMKFEVTGSELLRLTQSYTENNEAYQQYLVGRYHFGKRSVAGFKEAIKAFNLALERDDKFALAYAGLADCYNLLELYQGPSANAYPRAKQNALKALELDDQLAEAYSSLAYVKFYYDRDRSGAEQDFRRAIELNPGYVAAHHWFAHALVAQGRQSEALAEIRLAEQLDPRSAIIKTAVGLVYFYGRQYDQALAECRHALELDAGLVPTHRVMRWIYQAQNRYDEAFAAYQQEKSFSGFTGRDWPAVLAQLQAIGGRRAEASATLRNGLNTADGKREAAELPYEIALAYALIGDRDQAMQWLARAEGAKAYVFNFAQVDPRLDSLRDDPRFAALMRKAGM